MRISLFPLSLILTSSAFTQGTFCDPQGNVAIFSNYDGGALTINVDQDIPGLRIGIVSYEFAVINIIGPYVSNIVEVQWAGFNGNNDHCGTGAITQATVIGGVTSGISNIVVYPPSTFANANGWPNILCAYSCDISTQQGGCNTVDQVVDYFMDQWGGTLLFHLTQYGCWGGVYDISDGGNCCVGSLSTGADEQGRTVEWSIYPVPASNELFTGRTGSFEISDACGRAIMRTTKVAPSIDVSRLPPGDYRISSIEDGSVRSFVIQR